MSNAPNGHPIWLSAGSKAGGERAAAIYSVNETAKRNGVEPQAHIINVIEKTASGWTASQWDEFMSWNWTAQGRPASMRHDRSDRPDSHHARGH